MGLIQEIDLTHEKHAYVMIGAQEVEYLRVGKQPRVIIRNHSPTPCLLSISLGDGEDLSFFEAIKRAQAVFRKLEDSILYTVAQDGLPIGKRLEIGNVPEDTLRVNAQFEFNRREAERTREKERKSDRWKGMQIGLGVGSLLVAALGLVSKLLGWV